MVSSESQSSTRSRSESREYEDVNGSDSCHHVCANSSCTNCGKNKVSDSPRQIYYETMQFLLNEFAREEHRPGRDEKDEQETASHYYRGGYHILRLGETLNQKYLVYRKIGWDDLSTKWFARDCENDRYVTVTIFKGSEMHTEYATNLIRTFNKIQEHPSDRILKLLDHFQVIGVNGTHVCLVTEVMTECINNYMIRRNYKPVPIKACKSIVRQVLEGLHHLHTVNNLVHTTLAPESIFIKADKAFIMHLVYTTYVGYKSVLPVSFVCNLPSRYVFFKTKITDLSTEIFFQDKEFEEYEKNISANEAMSHVIEPVDVIETCLDEIDKDIFKGDIRPALNEVQAHTNSLIGRLSRFIKCKMNIKQSNDKFCEKSASSSSPRSTESSESKSSNNTNYESTSIRSLRSNNTTINCICQENEPSRRNAEKNENEKKENPDRDIEEPENLPEKLEILNIPDPVTLIIPTTSSSNNDKREISADESDIESQMKTMQIFLAETLIDQWYSYNNGQLKELDEKCKTIESQIQSECCSELDDERSCLNITPTSEEEIIGETLSECKLELNKPSEHEIKNDDDHHSNSDFLDDLSTSSDSSEKEDGDSDEHSCSETNVRRRCECHKCRTRSQTSEEKEDKSSQRESSYSTSTSTQQSYTEFLLNYCKHNNLCLQFNKYIEDAKQLRNIRNYGDSFEEDIEVVIADLENVRMENDKSICKDEIQRQYRAIELIYTNQFNSKIDIWSVACLTFELVTGDFMFNPTESKYYTIDEHHILKAIQLLAEIPPGLMEKERHIRNIKVLLERDGAEMMRLNARENFFRALTKSYRIRHTEAKSLTRLLVPMLRLNPANRSTAEQSLKSEWFSN